MPDSAPAGAITPAENRILAALPHEEISVLQPHLVQTDLPQGEPLYARDMPIEQVYFITSGVASMVTEVEGGMIVEIATVGPEGMIGVPTFLGDIQTASKAIMQISGSALRMPTAAFKAALVTCPTLQRVLLRFTLALMNQIAQNAACNRTHTVEERCARWLLMTQDRVRSPSFFLTQEFLGQMLGVRRPTVSLAAGMLARAGLIYYSRGQVTIRDRPGLLDASCNCYRLITGEFNRLLGSTAQDRDVAES
ncbi:MAG: Crp/Fnr family transcriptional regulator [Acetobacteraceae bacterium]